MKRISIVAVLACVASLTFAQNIAMSAGGKVEFAPMWTSTTTEVGGTDYEGSTTTNTIAFGGFFDATYVQAGLDYAMTIGKTEFKMDDDKSNIDMEYSMLNLSLLGKYPIMVNEMITAFPMAGFQYTYVLSGKVEGEKVDSSDLKDGNDFYVLVGGGADVNVNEKLYVRPTALFGINLTAKDGDAEDVDSIFASTLKIGVSVGYKL